MGWLFATTLGLQRKSLKVVLLSVIFVSLGHTAAIILTLSLVYFLKIYLPLRLLILMVSIILFSLGIYLLFRMKHPTWIGMNIGHGSLFLWSFLIASGHGAGLMLSPFLMDHPNMTDHAHQHMMNTIHLVAEQSSYLYFTLIIFVHMMGYLFVTTVLSVLVYKKMGLLLLKKVWFNFDLLWACVLLITGVILWLMFV